jgi:hypothetical protein
VQDGESHLTEGEARVGHEARETQTVTAVNEEHRDASGLSSDALDAFLCFFLVVQWSDSVTVMRRSRSRVPCGGGLALLPHFIEHLLPQLYHRYVM